MQEIESPAGVLSIPAIGLRVPIFHGSDELVLNRGVGRITGTADINELGNMGIAGHRDGFFRGLKDLNAGDVIEVQSYLGSTRYHVTKISIVMPKDTEVLMPTREKTLTLVTCYPFYFVGSAPERYIVQGIAEQ
jgi:sortase A